MALISCSRCRKQISSEATACRHCGASRATSGSGAYQPKPNFAAHYLMSILITLIGAGIYVAAVNGTEMSPYLVAASPILGFGGGAWYVLARIWAYMV